MVLRCPTLNCLALLVSIAAVLVGATGCGATKAAEKAKHESSRYHYNLAYGHYFDSTRPNVDGAMQEVLKSLRIAPKYPEAHMLAGLIYLGREIHVKAIRHFKKALELRPTYYTAANNLGAAYLGSGRWDDAIGVYKKLVGNIMYATPGHGHNNLGWAWFKKGDLDQARRHFLMAVNLAPQLCVAHNNLGIILAKKGNTRRAAKYFQRAIRKCPKYSEPHYHMGRLYGQQHKFPLARQSFSTCVKLAGDSNWGDRCEQRLSTLPRIEQPQ
jgi:type IV pilus assembly protein PilF